MDNFWSKFHYAGTLDADLGAGVEFEIDPVVAARISQLPEDCLKQLAISMAAHARRLAPVDSGELKAGIKAYKAKGRFGNRYYKVGTFTRPKLAGARTYMGSKDGKAVLRYEGSGRRARASIRRGYGAPVEFGHYMRDSNRMATKWVKPKPFLRPARVWTAQNVDMILKSAGLPLQ